MFEVGKSYKSRYNSTPIKPIAVAGDGYFAWAAISDGYATYHWGSSGVWTEVVEPRKEYFAAFKDKSGRTSHTGPFDNQDQLERAVNDKTTHWTRYGTLIVTHHSETKVETEFHLKRK